jgi:hypothetical protein
MPADISGVGLAERIRNGEPNDLQTIQYFVHKGLLLFEVSLDGILLDIPQYV